MGFSALVAGCDDATDTSGTGGGGGDGPGSSTSSSGTGSAPDTTPPVTSFGAAPGATQSAARPSAFSLTCSEADCTWECSLDGAPFAACDGAPSFDGLLLGDHTLAVRATDPAGNVEVSPKQHAWKVVYGWRDVAADFEAACAVSWDHQLYCWGYDGSEQLGDGPLGPGSASTPTRVGTSADWERVFNTYDGFCASNTKKDVYCWGDAGQVGDVDYGQSPSPTLRFSGLVDLGANWDAACGLDAQGVVSCVGWGANGLLGDGDLSDHYQSQPTPVGTDHYRSLGVGESHVCAVRDDGRLFCWGEPPLAAGTTATPTPVDAATDWQSVSAADSHTCAIKTDGSLYCWGRGYAGELGLGDEDDEPLPVRVGTDNDWARVYASGGSTCATKTDGTPYCWGSNASGEVGSTTAPLDRVLTPTLVSSSVGFARVSGPNALRCAETVDGFARCWGDNSSGALGRGVSDVQSTMTLIDAQFDKISSSDGAGGCGLAAGKLFCWGYGANAQPTRAALPSPTQIGAATDWTAISVSRVTPGHACGIQGGKLFCWGDNAQGQLGDGSTSASSPPKEVQVVGVPGWTVVTTGAYETCAITTESDLYCWGNNGYGQLGIGNTTNQPTPQKVPGTGWDHVALGFYRASAHKSDGTIWKWGVNDSTTPSQLPGNDWTKIGPTGYAECAIKTNGTLHCTQQGIPGIHPVGSATNWVDFLAVLSPYCALDSDGALSCFVPATQTTFNTSPSILSGTGWLSLSGGDTSLAGLKAGHERYARGNRRLGSFGDGFDERLPTDVQVP
ncbi:MAG: hypothetical protein U0414_12405 [Polyangiaceae bacterium]